MKKLSFNAKNILTLVFAFVSVLCIFAIGVFAVTKITYNASVTVDSTIYCSIELQKNGIDSDWKMVFDNFNKPNLTTNVEIVNGVITLKTDAFSSYFNNFTSSDKLYIKVTNYKTTHTLNAKVVDSETATITSYATDDSVLNDGVKYIATSESKTFYCLINANFTQDVEIPIELEISEFNARADSFNVSFGTNANIDFIKYNNQIVTATFSIKSYEDFTCLIKEQTGFTLTSADVLVKIGGTTIEETENTYSFNESTGELTIKSGIITGNIELTFTATPNS